MRYDPIRLFAALLAALALAFLITGCSDDDDDEILGPGDGGDEEEVFAWVWAYDADDDSLRVYDADDGQLHATYHALPHPLIREVLAGPETEPTVWMGSGGVGYAFSAGFHVHGDHAHMEIPEDLGTVATGAGNTHLSVDSHGETVAWANDEDQTYTLVDTETMAVTTLHHGSPHSASMVAHGVLVGTHMNEKWARIIDVATDAIVAEVPIDTLAHGDAYYHDAEQVFIPCLNGVDVVGIDEEASLGSIAYPDQGRVNFLFHGADSDRALAPVKLAAGSAAEIWILDMASRIMVDVPIAGAALAWNRGGGNISLSADGTTALLTDVASARAYVLDMATGGVTSLTVEAADMAGAVDFSGERIWLLDKGSGEVHYRHFHEGGWEEEDGFSVHAGSDWIFVTSFDPAVELIRD